MLPFAWGVLFHLPHDDQDKAVAWLLEQRDRCPGCGKPWHEATDPDLRREWVVVHDRCFACEAKGADKTQLAATGQSLDGGRLGRALGRT